MTFINSLFLAYEYAIGNVDLDGSGAKFNDFSG